MRGLLKHQRHRGEDLRKDLGLGSGSRRMFGPSVNFLPSGRICGSGRAPPPSTACPAAPSTT
ncbi:hypothetical protein NKH77_08955 [Streptomyces sp. M19]